MGTPARGGAPPRRGDVVYRTDFDGPDALAGWVRPASGVETAPGRQGTRAVAVERPVAAGPGSVSIRLGLPLDRIRGCRLRCEAWVRAEDVRIPANAWNGVKFMLHTVSPEGQRWEQQNDVHGTFDWKPVRFTADVPRDVQEASLILGLEATTGRACFDDISITVAAPPRSARPAGGGPAYRGHDLPRLRGVMIGPRVGADDLRVLGREWNANHVRWQLIWGGFPRSPADRGDLAAYDGWLDGELKRLDSLLPVCAELGIRVLIDLHTPPGGRDEASVCRLFQEKRFQEKFLEVWDRIARRYRRHAAVWGYDLVNEPVEGVVADGLMDWPALCFQAARRIRRIDPSHAIIVEPAPWGSPSSLEHMETLPVRGVVYSVHMYQPHRFTHQGVYGNPVGVRYPGQVEGAYWDKVRLRRALQPAIDFSRDNQAAVYIGEFSAIRWAPDETARDYLRDCIDIFEENGWDWAYHAFREWNGWSVEHGPDPKNERPSAAPTERKKLLLAWFAKNRRPSVATNAAP